MPDGALIGMCAQFEILVRKIRGWIHKWNIGLMFLPGFFPDFLCTTSTGCGRRVVRGHICQMAKKSAVCKKEHAPSLGQGIFGIFS